MSYPWLMVSVCTAMVAMAFGATLLLLGLRAVAAVVLP